MIEVTIKSRKVESSSDTTGEAGMYVGGLSPESGREESGDGLLVLFSVTTVSVPEIGEEKLAVDEVEYNRNTLKPV